MVAPAPFPGTVCNVSLGAPPEGVRAGRGQDRCIRPSYREFRYPADRHVTLEVVRRNRVWAIPAESTSGEPISTSGSDFPSSGAIESATEHQAACWHLDCQ